MNNKIEYIRKNVGVFSGFLFAGANFIYDIYADVGIALAVLYVVSVALTALDRRAKQVVGMAILCVILTVIGYWWAAQRSDTELLILNHLLAVFAIFTTMGLSLRYGRAARSSQETRDLYRALFDQTFQFVASLDSAGNIVEANQTLRDYAGLSVDEIASVPIWLLPIFGGDQTVQDRVREHVDSARSGNFTRDDFSIKGIGDKTTVIDFSLKPIRGVRGNIEQLIMEARDVTEVRVQHEMLVQAQKMESVGQLTAGIAHDFNNILMVIVGNLEILQNRLAGNDDAQDRLSRAMDAAFHGQTLTQQLLAFSRGQPLNPAVVNVNILLSGMSEIYEALDESIKVELDLDDDIPACEIDPTWFETAILNIAINARDAMPDGGVLRFETGVVKIDDSYHGEISDLAPGTYICLAISDSGTGMPKDVADRVFDPFFTTKIKGRGTGLGLSMVYGFVRQSGGDVKIYSEEGEGTTVRMYLPSTDKRPPKPDELEQSEAAETQELESPVLLVDDDEEIRDVIMNALLDMGFTVETAANGDAAIELIQSGRDYGIVVTDMVMSGEAGGPEVAQAARAVMPGIPIVFCSGFPQQTLENEEAAVEGALFLAKPFQQDALIDVIARALSRSRDEDGK